MESELINSRLKRKLPGLKLSPRTYQKEILCKTLEQNTIVYLGTGLGKTFIIVMYIQSPIVAEMIGDKRKVVFMAPTQHLIKQQAEYINNQVPFTSKVYCGRTSHCGEHIDIWSDLTWKKELQKVDILFMTPQIFASAISTNRLNWSQFSAIIFDECHHACPSRVKKNSGDPYLQILEHHKSFFAVRPNYVQYPRPRLIGLTASLINNMPNNRECIRIEVRQLEELFSASCATDIDIQETKPHVIVNCHSSIQLTEKNDTILKVLRTTADKIGDAVKTKKAEKTSRMRVGNLTKEQLKTLAFHRKLKLAALGFSIKPGNFSNVLEGLARVRSNGGLWMLSNVCKRLTDVLENKTQFSGLNLDVKPIYGDFAEILKRLHNAIENYLSSYEHKGILIHTRARPKALLDILVREHKRTDSELEQNPSSKKSFSCIIFVESRLEVVALNDWIKQVSATYPDDYGFIKSDYAIGIAATYTSKYACITKRKPTEQAKMLRDFRDGVLNVIISTSVLEEGIDLPVCSTVIRYDPVVNFRQHVQSRGRARQEISSFILMCEDTDYPKTIENLSKFNDFEVTLREILKSNDPRTERTAPRTMVSSSNQQVLDQGDVKDYFETNNNAVRISSSTAKTILAMYVNLQAKGTPFTEKIQKEETQEFLNGQTLYRTTLFLPSGCPLNNGIQGGLRKTQQAAENSAVVAAIRALYEAGELDEHGVPNRLTEKNVNSFLLDNGFEVKFDVLDKSLEGIQDECLGNYHYFQPRVCRLRSNYMSKDSENRTYKLFRIKYVADPENSRRETRSLLERSVFGLIVDSGVSNEFIPSFLNSHYGRFEVKHELISENLLIRRQDHAEYLNYTHKLLSKCLTIRVNKQDFRLRCLFYIVALDKENRPDLRKMQMSFGDSGDQGGFSQGDVVKVRGFYLDTRSKHDDRLMVVRKIYQKGEINIDTPGPRRRSLRQEVEYKYGKVISDPKQPVVEVMPLSKDFAKVKMGKKSKKEFSTQSVYYLEQFLEKFDEDASCVIQAFNKPEIIHRLYLSVLVSELDKEFVAKTCHKRQHVVAVGPLYRPVDLQASKCSRDESERPDMSEFESPLPRMRVSGDQSISPAKEDENGNEDVYSNEDANSDYEETDSDEESVDSNYSDDSELSEKGFKSKYEDMLRKEIMNLNGDEDNIDKWDMSGYKVANLQTVATEKRCFINPDAHVEYEAQTSPIFQVAKAEIELCRLNLIAKLEDFHINSSGDLGLEDESVLSNRGTKVDRSIVAPIRFDRNPKPLKEATRYRGLLEALTLSRAQESFNLEVLENIGDSYLKYVTSVILSKYTDGNEGFLTSARSRLTCNEHFTHLAKKNELGCFAITRPFDKQQFVFMLGNAQADELTDVEKFYNRMKPKNLADLFESIVGSYLVYHGEHEALLAIEWLGLKIFKDTTFEEFHENAVVFSKAPTALLESNDPTFRAKYKSMKRKLSRFENILGYNFNDESYLVQAFTHATAGFKFTRSYERLEFLGDAIIDFPVTMTLIKSGSFNDPGQITMSRSALVSNYSFAKLALKYNFDLFIEHCNSDLYDLLAKVREAMVEDPEMCFLDMVDFDSIVKLLGDVFEAVAGAIYLDSGCSLDTVWSVYYPMMKESIEKEIKAPTKNLTAALYETFPSARNNQRVTFESFIEKTSDGDIICVICTIAGYKSFSGVGSVRRQAKLRAVQAAMASLPSKETLETLNMEYIRKMGGGDGSNRRRIVRGGRGGGRGRGGTRGGGGGSFRSQGRQG